MDVDGTFLYSPILTPSIDLESARPTFQHHPFPTQYPQHQSKPPPSNRLIRSYPPRHIPQALPARTETQCPSIVTPCVPWCRAHTACDHEWRTNDWGVCY